MMIASDATKEAAKSELIKRSRDGGCWAIRHVPFGPIEFRRFTSPSAVPDAYMDEAPDGKLGYRGALVDFTSAARRREDQSAFSADR